MLEISQRLKQLVRVETEPHDNALMRKESDVFRAEGRKSNAHKRYDRAVAKGEEIDFYFHDLESAFDEWLDAKSMGLRQARTLFIGSRQIKLPSKKSK